MFVGVDLAWGDRRPTGVAVLDPAGPSSRWPPRPRTTRSPPVGRTWGDCLVAIDAPLVVVNPTGNRPCEAALNPTSPGSTPGPIRPTPASRSSPRLARRPAGRAPRARHRPGVALGRAGRSRSTRTPRRSRFPLGRTLKYKHGRAGPAELQGDCSASSGSSRGCGPATPPWPPRAAAWRRPGRRDPDRPPQERAASGRGPGRRRGVRLRRAVRRAAARGHPTYGDLATGYIVTPALPEGWAGRRGAAARRTPPVRASRPSLPQVQRATEHYARCSRRSSTTPASTTSASPAGPRAWRPSPRRRPGSTADRPLSPTRCTTSPTRSGSG